MLAVSFSKSLVVMINISFWSSCWAQYNYAKKHFQILLFSANPTRMKKMNFGPRGPTKTKIFGGHLQTSRILSHKRFQGYLASKRNYNEMKVTSYAVFGNKNEWIWMKSEARVQCLSLCNYSLKWNGLKRFSVLRCL